MNAAGLRWQRDDGRPYAVSAVLIDLDGTLLDTLPDLAEAANRTLVEIGRVPLPVDTIRTYVGKGIPNLVRMCLGPATAEAELARVVPVFWRHYAESNGRATTIYPGVMDGLARMRALGLPLGVVTNKAEAFIAPLLARMGLADYFGVAVGGDTTPERKPHPLPLLHACAALGAAAGRTLMIGDSVNDLAAARAAGCPAFCVPYGYNEGGDIRELDWDVIVGTLEEAAQRLVRA